MDSESIRKTLLEKISGRPISKILRFLLNILSGTPYMYEAYLAPLHRLGLRKNKANSIN